MVTKRIELPHLIIDDVAYQQDRTIVNTFFSVCCERMCREGGSDVCRMADEIFVIKDQIVIVVIDKIESKRSGVNNSDAENYDEEISPECFYFCRGFHSQTKIEISF